MEEFRVVKVSVAGDQISGFSTALGRSSATPVVSPPVTSTLPSGSIDIVWYARGKFMLETVRHAGEACVISRTYAAADTVGFGLSGSSEVPDFRTFPGRYITELPPSSTLELT